jgi:hypothetical protein
VGWAFADWVEPDGVAMGPFYLRCELMNPSDAYCDETTIKAKGRRWTSRNKWSEMGEGHDQNLQHWPAKF